MSQKNVEFWSNPTIHENPPYIHPDDLRWFQKEQVWDLGEQSRMSFESFIKSDRFRQE